SNSLRRRHRQRTTQANNYNSDHPSVLYIHDVSPFMLSPHPTTAGLMRLRPSVLLTINHYRESLQLLAARLRYWSAISESVPRRNHEKPQEISRFVRRDQRFVPALGHVRFRG